LGYLPLYVAIDNGYFKPLDVTTITLPSSASAHSDAVLTGKAWGFIGGPEHNAFADIKGANLRAIANIVNRGNVYFVARKGLTVPRGDLKNFIKGKTIAVSGYGGTPNSIARYFIDRLHLDPKKDVTLMEVTNPAIPAIMTQGKADIAVVSEPMLTKGVGEGIWQQPFYNAPKAFGPYAYSTINVSLSTITGDPTTTRTFVAGMLKALAFIRSNHDGAMAIAAKEFPDLSPPVLKGSMQRAYDDELWEWSGKITPGSVVTAESVVKTAGLLAVDVPYSEIVDLRFINPKATGAR